VVQLEVCAFNNQDLARDVEEVCRNVNAHGVSLPGGRRLVKRWHTAYLVKSVRVDGKARHETIAPLVSMQWNTEGDLIGWVKLEMKVQELTLSEQERAQIYRLFAQKVSRPPMRC
jgi:hypothetical protein